MSAPYREDNLLDRISDEDTLELHYDRIRERERELLDARLGMDGGRVLSVGCGWHPGRHLFPKPAWHMTGVELEQSWIDLLVEAGDLDDGFAGRAGELDRLEDASFDVVLYRLVLHHIAYQDSLGPPLAEARRLLRPGGALVAVEPGSWHPVGAALTLANRLDLGTMVHGTPDDIPLSPRRLEADARAAGFEPELHAVTYSWRRLPPGAQRALHALDAPLGSRLRSAPFGHTLLLLARA
ncbi:MAG TPA: methyltransferase domain-containing protein [Thermoleophilaceae bacterium]|nr:methyltransferase domain-containing protein [Thermoleophilaceae bacterium]